MYKVKEAADQLGVSRVEIFEILLSQRDVFEPYVTKKNSITYISEEGLVFLKERIALQETRDNNLGLIQNQENTEPHIVNFEDSSPVNDLTANTDIEDIEQQRKSDHQFESREASEFEEVDDALSEWLREIQDETLLSETYDSKLKEIRTQITMTRNKILGLDSEIKMKEDALRHYHEIMKDDIRWLEDLERKIQIIVKSKFLEQETTVENLDGNDEDKSNFRKFFKR